MSPELYILFLNAANFTIQNNFAVQKETNRILAKHYEPFMYKNVSGNFYDGIEFKLIETIAAELHLNVEFVDPSKNFGRKQLHRQKVDIITSGVVPHFSKKSRKMKKYTASVPYLQDYFIWCIQDAGKIPVYLNYFQMAPMEIWLIGVTFFVYMVGSLLFIGIELDESFKNRPYRDWHYFILLITLPAIIAVSPRFHPLRLRECIFYFALLTLPLPIPSLIGTFSYNFMKFQFPRYQVSTVQEIVRKEYRLVGSTDVLYMINHNTLYLEKSINSFYFCDINNCLNHLKRSENDDLAVGGSRQHILNCPEYTPSKVYCFKKQQSVASYQPALLIRKTFHLKSKIDKITRRLFEAGFFPKWSRDSQRRRKYEIPYIAPLEMQLIHLYFALVFPIFLGSAVSITTFIAELFISYQTKRPNNCPIWSLLEKFFTGHRYCFNDWPRRLLEKNRGDRKE